jgi:putative flippase GtrA
MWHTCCFAHLSYSSNDRPRMVTFLERQANRYQDKLWRSVVFRGLAASGVFIDCTCAQV